MSDYTVGYSSVHTSYSVIEFILDFQGFININNEFMVKESAFVSFDGSVYEMQLFQPPCQFQQLPTQFQHYRLTTQNN